jgi:hypothetical protein
MATRYLHRSRAGEVGVGKTSASPRFHQTEAVRNSGGKRVQPVGDLPCGTHTELPEIPQPNLADGACEISWQTPAPGFLKCSGRPAVADEAKCLFAPYSPRCQTLPCNIKTASGDSSVSVLYLSQYLFLDRMALWHSQRSHFTHQEAGISGLFNPVLPCQNFRNEADQNFRNGNRQLPALALAKSCRIRMIAVLPRSFKPTARSGRLTDFRAEPRKQTNLFSIRSAGCQD